MNCIVSYVVIGHYAVGHSYVAYGPEAKSRAKLAIQWLRRYYPMVSFTIRPATRAEVA